MSLLNIQLEKLTYGGDVMGPMMAG